MPGEVFLMDEMQLSPVKAQIQMMYPVFSRSNRQIANYLLKDDCDISDLTIAEFAEKVEECWSRLDYSFGGRASG